MFKYFWDDTFTLHDLSILHLKVAFVFNIKCFYFGTGETERLIHGKSYFVTITAINTVDLETYAFSGPIAVDTTPPNYGKVINLHSTYRIDATSNSATVDMNANICNTDEGNICLF